MKSFVFLCAFISCCFGEKVSDEKKIWEIEQHRELFLGLEMGINRDNYSCPDFDLGSLCDTDCRVDYIGCRQDCSEIACENECVIVYGECLSDCPCGVNCVEGCLNCPHPLCEKSPCDDIENNEDFKRCEAINKNELNQCIDACNGISIDCYEICANAFVLKMKTCPCFEGCPQGCPFCPAFECEPKDTFTGIFLTSETSVFDSEIFSIDGQYQASYSMDSTIYGVSAIYQGIVYLFGGRDEGFSIQKINGCSLVTLSTTLINAVYIDSSYVSIEGQGVYTCFRSNGYKWCQLFNGSSVRMIDYEAARDKEYACMATYDGMPAAIGGDGGKYIEVLYSNGWSEIGEHPADTRYGGCLTIDDARKMVTIGGNDDNVIHMYHNNSWVYLGTLKFYHYLNSVLLVGDYIISAAGWNERDSEYELYSLGIERIKITDGGFTSEIIVERNYYDVYPYRPVLFETEQGQCLAWESYNINSDI